jgi:lipid II:glycine glycyltransferase (peptidoglycan interpeptide bridge formation enzyme)
MVHVREIRDDEKGYWNEGMSRFQSVHPLNAFGWGVVRGVDGWTPIYLVAECDGEFKGGLMILEKKIPFTPFSIFYGPRGPVWDLEDKETLRRIIDKTKVLAKERRAIFLRIDPSIPEDFTAENGDPFLPEGFKHLEQRWTFWNTPRDVSRIDLTKAETPEKYFNLLNSDARRRIRKAKKDGVTIEPATTEEELRVFYDIFSAFSVNKGFMARGFEYQRKLWESYIAPGMGRLFLAKHDGEIIGGLMCIMFGNKCLNMHMGTPSEYNRLHSSYAYVWEAIKWSKENGCDWFSFRGVGTTPSQEHFKNKFNTEAVALVGYYDLPFRKIIYRLFYFCEFQVLPRAWPLLIRMRKLHHSAVNLFNKGHGERAKG